MVAEEQFYAVVLVVDQILLQSIMVNPAAHAEEQFYAVVLVVFQHLKIMEHPAAIAVQ